MLDRQLYSIIVESLGPEYIDEYPHEFEKRVIVQKILFLLTHIKGKPKISLPYEWTFYLRGPYSSEIAHMLYYMQDFSNNLRQQEFILEEKDQQVIKQFKDLSNFLDQQLAQKIGLKTVSDKIMESLATLVYISEQVEGDEAKILTIFQRLKPKLAELLKEDLIKVFIKSLKKFQFI